MVTKGSYYLIGSFKMFTNAIFTSGIGHSFRAVAIVKDTEVLFEVV